MSSLPQNDLSPLLLDTPTTYYWIGFILADGHYNRPSGFTITLSSKDKDHLVKLQQYLKSRPVRDIKSYGKRCYPQSRICFNDKNIAPIVVDKFGIRRDKTYYPPDLSWIEDKDLFLSLFAGYIDGDGCMETAHNVRSPEKPCSIRFHIHIAWEPVLLWMRKKLIEFYGYDIALPEIKKDGYLKWSVSNFELIKSIGRDIRRLNLPVLNRKWDKINYTYLTLKEKENNELKIIINNQDKTSNEISLEFKIPYYRITLLRKKLKELNKNNLS